uniref:Putative structural protein n=2 Tax=viral metagenome TaxID=1070528 RepID=A0A6M3KHY6_9ZZZZ
MSRSIKIPAAADILSTGLRSVAFSPTVAAALNIAPGLIGKDADKLDEAADAINRFAAGYREAAAENDNKGITPAWFKRSLRGAGESIYKAVPMTMAAGPYGTIAAFGAMEANQAITEGRDKGLKGGKLARYVVGEGVIEALPALVMQRFAPGLEGVLGDLFRGGAKQAQEAVGMGIMGALKHGLVSTLQEVPEELVTEIGHALHKAVAGTEPTSLGALVQTAFDTTVQTLMAMGAATAPAVAPAAIASAVRVKQLKAIRATEGSQLKRRAAEAGITGTRSEVRKKLDAEIQQAEQETQRAIQEREAETVHAREAPGDREEVGPEVRRQGAEEKAPEVQVEPRADEPPVAKGMTRLYHGSATPGRYDGPAWFSTDRAYAESYRGGGAELQYVDVPTEWVNQQADPDKYGQTPERGFTWNVELDSKDTGPRKPLSTASGAEVQVEETPAAKPAPQPEAAPQAPTKPTEAPAAEPTPRQFQDKNQEQVVHGKHPEAESFDKGSSYRYILEGSGDVFREFAKTGPYRDAGYIREKLRRLQRYLDGISRVSEEDTFDYSKKHNPKAFALLKNLWESQPTDGSDGQRLAVELNKALVDHRTEDAQRLVTQINDNLKSLLQPQAPTKPTEAAPAKPTPEPTEKPKAAPPRDTSTAVDIAQQLDHEQMNVLLGAFQDAHKNGYTGREAQSAASQLYYGRHEGPVPKQLNTLGKFNDATAALEAAMRPAPPVSEPIPTPKATPRAEEVTEATPPTRVRTQADFEAMHPRELGEYLGDKWVGKKKTALVEQAMAKQEAAWAAPEPAAQPETAAQEAQRRAEDEGEFGEDVSQVLGIATGVPLAGPRGGIGKSMRHFFQRFFTSRGELPVDVYNAKVRRDGRVAKEMNQLRNAATDFRRGIRAALKGKELTQADIEKMNAVLRGQADPSTVPGDVRAPIQAMRDHIDALSRRLIAEGVAQGDLVGIITEHMGVYATRSYRVFDDPKWRDKVPEGVRNRAWNAISQMYPDKSEAERLGILESLLFRGAAETPVGLLKGSKLGSKDLSTFMRRKDVPEWLRDLWGEYKDAGVNYARSVFKMSHLLANQQFLNEVREAGLGKWLRTQEDGPIVNEFGEVITPIAAEGSSVMAPLNGLYTTPEIKAAFERFDSPGAMPNWLRAIMSVNYVVKYGKTVGSLMTHIRNLISNTGFTVANGHWRLDKAGKAMWATATGMFQLSNTEYRAYYNRLAELGLVGEDVRAGELKDALRDASKADIDEFLYNREARHAKKIVRTARAGYRGLNALYQAEDGVWKIYAWENEKARYTKAHPDWSQQQIEEHAAKIVRDTYPTYSKIYEGIKALRRFPVIGTFVSFPAEVVRTTLNTARIGFEEMQAPETRAIGAQRLAGTAIALGGLSVLSLGMRDLFGIGDDEDDDLRWFVPPWQENSRFIYTSKPQDATYRFVDLGYSDPHAYLTDSVIAFIRGEDWMDAMGQSMMEFLRPFTSEEILWKALSEVRENKDDKVYNPKDEVGEQAKGIVSHMWTSALEPGTVSSLRRIHEAVTGTNPNRETKTEVLALTTGQRLQTIDVEHSLGFRVRDFAKALTTIQAIARKTATSRGTATGEMVAKDVSRMEKVRLAEFSEIQKIVGAARRLGVPEDNIKRLLKAELSDDVAEQVLTGDYSPYAMTPETVRQMMGVRPEEFSQRFSGWHGKQTPEAIKQYVTPRLGNIPYKEPERKKNQSEQEHREALKDFQQSQATIKNELDMLGITHDQAQELLVEYFWRPDKEGKIGSEMTKARKWTADYKGAAYAIAKLYGKDFKKDWYDDWKANGLNSQRNKKLAEFKKKAGNGG